MHLPKKVFLVIFLFLLFLLPVFPRNAAAQAPGDVFEQSYEKKAEDEKKARDAEKGEEVQIWSTRVSNQALGDVQFNLINQILPLDPDLASTQGSAIGTIASLMGAMYEHPPASALVYTYDLLANAGFVKKAYAQGIGFAGLSPLLSLWKTARNIAYAALVLVMLAIGLMLIFRVKIDPKTVISIQAALPKIIMSLILITFSYPIAGLMIDIMYLSMAIIISLLAQGMGPPFSNQIQTLQSQYMAGGVNILFGSVFGSGFRTLDDFFKAFYGGLIGSGATAGILKLIPIMIRGWLGAGIVTALPAILFLLILVLGLLFTFIRLLMLLINSYIQIIISVILAPLLLLTEAIPGRSAFKGWILNIAANLVVFPATAAVLMFAMFLTTRNVGESPWMAPLIWLPGASQFGGFLGLSVIFMAPSLVASIKKVFHPKPAMPITAGTAFAPLTGGAQTAMGAASQFYYMKGVFDMFGKKGRKE